eukprot:INCI14625.1.p1 GENE.INCI14625.1~~INCI14625.1.p1  ORF type:complete len:365 (-),score=59.36 INCI14625.1:38-1132(-)
MHLHNILATAIAASQVGASMQNDQCPVGNWTCSSNTLIVNPVGNSFETASSLSMHGTTSETSEREFLVDFGLVSNQGNTSSPPTTPYHDKVTLYASIVAEPGTGDVWAINPLLTQSAGSGDYNAQGIELDFNNNNAHRGDADAGAGLAAPVSYGLSVTGAGAFRGTAAYAVSGPGHRIWNRGIVFANDAIQQSTFQDLGNPEKSVDIRGNPTYGVYQSSSTSKNYFAGQTNHGGKVTVRGKSVIVGGEIDEVDFGDQDRHEIVCSGNTVLPSTGATTVSLAKCHGVQFPDAGKAGTKHDGQKQSLFDEFARSTAVYTVTAIGGPSPNLHVAKELSATGEFSIAGGLPSGKVSWTVRTWTPATHD